MDGTRAKSDAPIADDRRLTGPRRSVAPPRSRRRPRHAGHRSRVSTLTMSLVIPAKNEAANIGWVLERVPDVVDEIVVVDGQSTDGTVEAARRVRPDIVAVSEDRPGKGAALRAGFGAARAEAIVMIDADGSMDPCEIERFAELLVRGYDVVKGSRFLAGGGSADLTGVRRLGNQALCSSVNALYGCGFSDLCYGYFAFHRRHLGALDLSADGFEIETEIVVKAIKADLRIGEVASLELPRRTGESNLRAFRDGRRVLRTLLRERLRRNGVTSPPVDAGTPVAPVMSATEDR
jgi:glycosyltransferase involved in cell wall biosynthesis